MIDERKLTEFLLESNRIESIFHVRPDEIAVAATVLASAWLTIPSLTSYVTTTQPGAVLRDQKGLDVQVGRFVPPRGGPHIIANLDSLLIKINGDQVNPFEGHLLYEMLHPFTDGNGRSGRLAWYWHMQKRGGVKRPFLHQWYYDSLEALG